MSEDNDFIKRMTKGEFEYVRQYILKNALKLPDGTPIFSARHFASKIDEAREEIAHVIYSGTDLELREVLHKWFGRFDK